MDKKRLLRDETRNDLLPKLVLEKNLGTKTGMVFEKTSNQIRGREYERKYNVHDR